MGYQTIEVRKLTPAIGAEIFGVDLAQPLGNQTFQEIHDALMDNLVIFFRDQVLTHEQHKAFGRRFGELHLHPTSTRGDGEHPEILVIKADERSKHVAGEEWHSDVSCDPEPPMGSILYMKELPPDGGGNTLFANMYRAYETLTDEVKAKLAGKKAWNVYDYQGNPTRRGMAAADAPRCAHPLFRTHPATGRKALYANRLMTVAIEGMAPAESDRLLELLFDHAERPEFVYQHAWRPGDLILWDNRCTLHARTDFDASERRKLRRVALLGEAPV